MMMDGAVFCTVSVNYELRFGHNYACTMTSVIVIQWGSHVLDN
jgi:hypothetical protein